MIHGAAHSDLRSQRRQHLSAARTVGAAAAAIIAQVVVDMPDGYFGGADQITPFGAFYAALVVLATAVAVLAGRPPRSRFPWIAPALLSLNAGLFVAPLYSDPLVSGLAAAWNLTILAKFLFPLGPRISPIPPGEDMELDTWLSIWGSAARHLSTTALVLTTAVVGYEMSRQWLPYLICLALNLGALGVCGRFLLLLHRRRRRGIVLVILPLLAGLAFVGRPSVLLIFLATAQILLLVQLIRQTRTAAEVLRSFLDRPARLILTSFVGLILLGAVLLTFPAAAAGAAVSPLDALFTATSAACVTGLIVLDTPHDFSLFGQIVVLALLQIGGLGIMVLSTFATLALGGSLDLRGEQVLREMLETRSGLAAYRLTRFIVLSTLAIEALGAIALAWRFSRHGAAPAEALWQGLFHSVSAFCNAGFALWSDSLVGFQTDPIVLLVVAALILFGGIGFTVLATLAGRPFRRRRGALPIQARIVLVVSAFLLAVGWALYVGLEWQHSLAGLDPADRVVNAFFQSVTTRTAGFNSVDLAATAPATVLALCALMFVGASSGSTGGGIKTTTAAVLLAAVRATVRGGGPATLFDREIPRATINRSLAITLLAGMTVGGGLFLLSLTETQPLEHLLFEVVSAVGTVGLSLGATAKLSAAGKLIVSVLMLAGRVGPLTLVLWIGEDTTHRPTSRRPRASIMVG